MDHLIFHNPILPILILRFIKLSYISEIFILSFNRTTISAIFKPRQIIPEYENFGCNVRDI